MSRPHARPAPGRKRVVVVGCGFGGATAVRELARKGAERLELIAFNKSPFLYNYPVLPRLLVEEIPEERIAIPLARLFQGLRVDLRIERVDKVDAFRRTLHTGSGPLTYDYLVLGLGARAIPLARASETFLFFPKAARHLSRLRGLIARAVEEIRVAPIGTEPAFRIAILGGGLTGIEFAMALREAVERSCRRARITPAAIELRLYERGPRLIPAARPALGQAVEDRLLHKGIAVEVNKEVLYVQQRHLFFADEVREADAILCCIGSHPELRAELSGLGDLSAGIPVNAYLQSPLQPEVFALGDNARLAWAPPLTNHKSAARAKEQGRLVARNILRHLSHRPLLAYRPRERPIAITLGSRAALIAYGPWRLGGHLVGRFKKYLELHHF